MIDETLQHQIESKLTPIEQFVMNTEPQKDWRILENGIIMDRNHICAIGEDILGYAKYSEFGLFNLDILIEILQSFQQNGEKSVNVYLKNDSPIQIMTKNKTICIAIAPQAEAEEDDDE